MTLLKYLKHQTRPRQRKKLMSILDSVKLKHTTAKRISRSKFTLKPWITPGLMKCMRHRDQLHLKARNNPNDTILQITYKRYKNFCNDLLKKT